jgi:release factor H-coupled RctB family protein
MLKNELKIYCSPKKLDGKVYLAVEKKNVIAKIISIDSYISEESVKQLQLLETLDEVTHIYGMPDLHPGPGCPIGAVTITDGVIHPHLIGDDIGCGMSFVKTGIPFSNITKKKLVKLAETIRLEGQYDNVIKTDDLTNFCNGKYVNILNDYAKYIGTVGAGNHFAELQTVEKIYDNDLAQKYDININEFYLTVHSGSRGLGEHILTLFQNKEINIDEYKDLHSFALLWAKHNRSNIANRFLQFITSIPTTNEFKCIADMSHNYYEEMTYEGKNIIIHRKGAAPCYVNPIIIPGSRGARTYIVFPIRSDINHGFSVSHGAGRKVTRKKAYALMSEIESSDRKKKLENDNTIDNIVLCEDQHMFYEEAPFAYKDIDVVVNDLVSLGLVKIIVSMIPVITYKHRV